MQLYLVRHARAKPKEDPQRSLSDTGRAEIEKVARFVAQTGLIKCDSILHSGKTRAEQTAEVLKRYLNPPNGMSAADGLKPMDKPIIWAEKLTLTRDNLLLVGHLPHLDKLASILLCGRDTGGAVVFQNACIVCLNRGEAGSWSLAWAVIPDLLV